VAFRDDLTAQEARHDALAAEVAHKTRELDEARQQLAHARARASLPVLDNIRVATPCPAQWHEMTGDDRSRHCGSCNKSVHDLSGLTREEAEALVVEKAGSLCARYFQRTDGTILFADCKIGITRRRRRRLVAAGIATLLASGAGVLAHHQLHQHDDDYEDGGYIMGDIGAPAIADRSALAAPAPATAPATTIDMPATDITQPR